MTFRISVQGSDGFHQIITPDTPVPIFLMNANDIVSVINAQKDIVVSTINSQGEQSIQVTEIHLDHIIDTLSQALLSSIDIANKQRQLFRYLLYGNTAILFLIFIALLYIAI